MQRNQLSMTKSSYRQKNTEKQLFRTFKDLKKSPEDEMKLIQRSLTKSYIASMSKYKVSEIQNDLLKFQSNIIHEQMSAIEKQPVQQLEQQNEFFINVKNGIQPNTFWCCGEDIPIEYEHICMFSDSISNELIIKNKQNNSIVWNFNLNVLRAQIKPSQSKTESRPLFRLSFGQKFYLEFSDNQQSKTKQLNNFIVKLQKKIKQSDAIKYQINEIVQIPEFQYNKYKLQREFVKNCKTGDILLFRSPSFCAKAQRFLTQSNFDHVGVIIRDPVYDILIYQSNGNTGVCLTPWKLVVKYKWYESLKFVWRKLENIQRSDEFIQKFHEFVIHNMNAKYHISLEKLFSRQSFIAQKQQEQGYFCSQLVARVYKILKLLPSEDSPDYKPACNYYPLHFSQKHNIKLTRGSLSPQYEIVFNQNVLQDDYQ